MESFLVKWCVIELVEETKKFEESKKVGDSVLL